MSNLGDQLARAAGDTPGPLDVDDLRRRADQRRRRTRTVRAVGIVAAALVVIAATVAVLSQRSTSTDVAGPERTGNGVGEPGKWVPIAKAPIAPRRNAVTVWTGSEVLVFGGFSSVETDCNDYWPNCGGTASDGLRSGAAYDPDTDTWRPIAPLPVGSAAWEPQSETSFANAQLARLGSATLDGTVYTIAHGTARQSSPQLLSYDLKTDTWRVVTALTGQSDMTRALTVWDGKLLVYTPEATLARQQVRVYEPSSHTWSDLSPLPGGEAATTGATVQFIAHGSRLFAFIATTSASPPESGGLATITYREVVSMFDGTRWQEFSHPGGSGGFDSIWAATGDTFTMINPMRLLRGSAGSPSTTAPSMPPEGPTVLSFDPETGGFTEPTIPTEVVTGPIPSTPAVVADGQSLALVGPTASAILDGDSGGWTVAHGPSVAQLDEYAAVWAGHQLLLWGGFSTDDHTSTLSNQGWIWTPPGASTGSSSSVPSDASPSPTTAPPTGPTVAQLAAGTWHDLPMPTVAIAGDAGVVWTGTRLFAWGGSDDAATQPGTDISRSGALYDPATRQWRSTAPAPITPRSHPTTVWTGSEVIVWGGLDASRHVVDDGAAYNPATDMWHELPSTNAPGTGTRQPGVRPTMQAAVWTGSRLAVFTPVSSTATDSSTIAQSFYDPSTDVWVERAPKHDARAENRLARIDAVASGGHTLVWLSWSLTMKQRTDGSSTEDLPPEQSLFEVDTTPDTGSIGWTRVSVPAATPIIADPIDAGGVVAATTNPYSLDAFYRGPAPSAIPTVVLSLTEGRSGSAATFKEMPQGGLDTTSQPQVWTGDAILRFNVEGRPSPTSRQQPGDLDALDWNNRAWTALPRSPWDADSGALRLVWAGDRLIVWGQLTTTCADQSDGCTPFQGRRILGAELVPG